MRSIGPLGAGAHKVKGSDSMSMSRGGESPTLTIIIPVLNGAGSIVRAIRSALDGADELSVEVLVVDDGSTDGTERLIQEHFGDVVTVLRTTHHRSGPGAARNVGLDAARGEWIALLDADDWWSPGRASQLLASALQSSSDVAADDVGLYSGALLSGTLLEARGLSRRVPTELTELLVIQNDLGLLQPVFRRRLLADPPLRQIEGRVTEDFDFLCRLLRRAKVGVLVPNPMYCYRISDNGSSASHASSQFWLQSQACSLDLLRDSREAPLSIRAGLERRADTARRNYMYLELRKSVKERDVRRASLLISKAPSLVPMVIGSLMRRFRTPRRAA